MYRRFTLLTALIGILLMEFGCDDNYGVGGPYGKYIVTNAESTFFQRVDSLGNAIENLVSDTTAYNRFLIRTLFESEYIVTNNPMAKQFAAYAEPVMPPPIEFDLDSIEVRNISTVDSLDITNLLLLKPARYSDYTIAITNDSIFRREMEYVDSYSQVVFDFYLANQPEDTLLVQFEFTYYLASQDSFKTTTNPITIIP